MPSFVEFNGDIINIDQVLYIKVSKNRCGNVLIIASITYRGCEEPHEVYIGDDKELETFKNLFLVK